MDAAAGVAVASVFQLTEGCLARRLVTESICRGDLTSDEAAVLALLRRRAGPACSGPLGMPHGLPVMGTDNLTGQPFRPSQGRQVEAGLKHDARGLGPGYRLFATLAGFRIRQRNVVTTGTSIMPVFGTQSGEVEVYGVEAEVVALLFDQLSRRVAVNSSNVFNKLYVARCGGPVSCTYGAGAQVIGTVTKNF